MKTHKRIPALLLTASMALAMLSPAWAAEPRSGELGNMRATLRIDYSQTLSELQRRGIEAELFQGDKSLFRISMTRPSETALNTGSVQVSLRDRLGEEHTGSALPGALDLSVTGLPQGQYTLRFTGEGYAPCSTGFTLKNYDQYIEAGTGDGTFPLGDVDGSDKVDSRDREALSAALGSTRAEDQDRYDLNGDGKIDIVDLAYVNHNAHAPAVQPTVTDTACFSVKLDNRQAEALLVDAGTVASGSLDSLLQEDGLAVTFQNASGSGDIAIPVPLSGTVEAENLQIVTPDGVSGSIQAGTVEVEYEGGSQPLRYSFDNTLPAGIHALTRTPGSNVITIALGRRVAVKKVTITVTKSADGQYAVVETIRFLKDIVPENLTQPNSEVKRLAAQAGDSLVELTWQELPNVSGYRVEYWAKGQESARRRLSVDVPRAQITGLDNLKTYLFTVTPVDGSWQGTTCPPVEATPQPAKAPSAPDMVSVTPLDGQLKVSWKQAKNATWYEVYYTGKANAAVSEYQQVGGRLTDTQFTISGLTNGVTYYLYVVSGNEAGKSGPSRISSGTPVATDYSRPTGLPTEGILDHSKIESIVLGDPGNYHAPAYPSGAPFTPQYMIDGDYRTHWTASTNYERSEHVNVTFKEPVDLSCALWSPRLDGSFPSYLRAYSVRVWYDGEESGKGHLLTGGIDNGGGSNAEVWSWPEIPNKNSIPTDRFAILPFGPVKNVTKVSVAVEQAGYNQVSCSELMFMEYDPEHCLPDDIAALFADDLHTELVSGVTQEQIDGLKTRMSGSERNYYFNARALDDELLLAQELLDNKTTSGVVLRGIQSRSSAADSQKYSQGGSELQPLGVAAKAGQEITVYASGIPQGETVSVKATQFNAEVSAWQANIGTLVNGRNVFTVPKIGSQDTERGGSLYLTYSGSAPESISLHIRRAVDIPCLELSDWYSLDEMVRRDRIGAYVDELTAYTAARGINSGNALANCLNVTEISTPSVLLSLPAAAVLNANGLNREEKVENLYQNILAWEDVMHICKTTQGIDNTYENNDMASRQNIRCMQMFSGAFMYAAGSHIGIGYGSCAGVVSGRPIAGLESVAAANHLFGWGIAHEIGHNMDKLGRAEITNNIYSLMVQTFDGRQNTLPSRLEKSGKYAAIFTKTAQGRPGASNDVFVQLGMYWQLHLAYDGGDKPMDFYNRFFKAWKAGTYTQGFAGLSYDEKVALTASGTANADLTEFFTRWGMALSDGVKTQLETYGREDRALWYLSDQSRRERLAGTAAAGGSLTASAQGSGENQVTITIQPDITGKVQGYEILRSGTPIAFVTAPNYSGRETVAYTDTIGSGNHRVYAYQVRAYGVQGEKAGEADAGEVRIAYDKTVAPGVYELSRSGDTVTFTLNNAAPVTGFKITGDTLPQGEYTVTVLTEKDQTLTAREGSFQDSASLDGGGFVAYFNNPKADSGDTSIYTYDAKAVTITGVPEELAKENIRLISYAGDDISFYAEGTMGLLSADWQYGDNAEDKLLQGTLVILGEYRGDPVWCTAEVWGRFENSDGTVMERPLKGETILLADPTSLYGDASDISDGLLIFVPQYDSIADLPGEICLKLFRTDVPNDASSRRATAETLWISTFDGNDLPTIQLKEGNP